MGLRTAVRRFATSRPHLLLLEEPSGGLAARCAVERWARLQGWPLVDGPADADVLVIAGPAAGLGPFADVVWDQLPGPRSRVRVTEAEEVPELLERARRQLPDVAAQRPDSRRADPPATTPPAAGQDMSGHDMSGHAGHDMSAPGADPHAGHDMSGMAMPAGLAMADRATDRDGLKLDVLTVPWGPALPWWPAGLVVTTTLQGDVIQAAEATRLGDPDIRREDWPAVTAYLAPPHAAAAARLDALTRLLAVAGWAGARVACQRLRDDLLTGTAPEEVRPRLERLARRVGGSRPLARMTSGIGTSEDEDVTGRYRRWLAESVAAVDRGALPPISSPDEAGSPDDTLDRLPGLLVGKEIAAARLVVASLDLALSGAGHGARDHV